MKKTTQQRVLKKVRCKQPIIESHHKLTFSPDVLLLVDSMTVLNNRKKEMILRYKENSLHWKTAKYHIELLLWAGGTFSYLISISSLHWLQMPQAFVCSFADRDGKTSHNECTTKTAFIFLSEDENIEKSYRIKVSAPVKVSLKMLCGRIRSNL